VRKDETLADVAARFGIDDPQEIKELNTLPTDKLRAGQRLRVFVEVKYHKVDPGQNMGDLAEKYLGDRNRTGDLMELNGMKGAGALFPGQLVKIPVEAVIGAGPEPLPRASDRDTLRSRDRAPEVAPPPKLTGEAVPTAALGQSRLDLIESFGFAKGTQEYEAVKANLQEDIKSPLTADEFLQMNGKTYETRFDFAVDFFMELKNRRAAENLELPAIAAYDPKLRFITPGGAKATQLQGTDPSKDPVAGVTVDGKYLYVGIYLFGGDDQVKNAKNAAVNPFHFFEWWAEFLGPGVSLEYYSDNMLKAPGDVGGGDVAVQFRAGMIGRLRNLVNKYYAGQENGNTTSEYKAAKKKFKKQQKAQQQLDAERKASAAAPAYAQLDAQKKQMGMNAPRDVEPAKVDNQSRKLERGEDGQMQPVMTPWDRMLEQLPPGVRAMLDYTVVDGKIQFKEDMAKPFGSKKTRTIIADPAKALRLRLGMPAENFAEGMKLIVTGRVEEGMAKLFEKFNIGINYLITDTGERTDLPVGQKDADTHIYRDHSGTPRHESDLHRDYESEQAHKGNPAKNPMPGWEMQDNGSVLPVKVAPKPKFKKEDRHKEGLPIEYWAQIRIEPANIFKNLKDPAASERGWYAVAGVELEAENMPDTIMGDFANKSGIGKETQKVSRFLYELATLPITPAGVAKAAAQEAISYAKDMAVEMVVDQLTGKGFAPEEANNGKKKIVTGIDRGSVTAEPGDIADKGGKNRDKIVKGKLASKDEHRLLPHETGVGMGAVISANNMGRVQVENENGELELRYVMKMNENVYLMPASMTGFFDMIAPGAAMMTKPEGAAPAMEPTADFEAGFVSDFAVDAVQDVITGDFMPSEGGPL
jgi:hypothetical protein